MRNLTAIVLAFALLGNSAHADSPWTVQPSGTTERLRGVAAVDDRVVWAVGNHATCVRTLDGGATWAKISVPDDAHDLDFRDVEAFDGERAYILAIGPGDRSRVFKATHHGTMLVECYRNPDPNQFLDAIAFWDYDHGIALSDPVDGRFVIMATDDAGRSWEQRSAEGTMPPSLPNEGAFAASGTCLVVGPDREAWFGTGGAKTARLFRTRDAGRSWQVFDTSTRADSPSRGIFGLAFREPGLGMAVGGDYKAINEPSASCVSFGGVGDVLSISRVESQPPGFRSAVAYVLKPPPGRSGAWANLLTLGPGGTDVFSGEEKTKTWRSVAGADGFHALSVSPSGRLAWAVGEGGKVGRLVVAEVFPPLPSP